MDTGYVFLNDLEIKTSGEPLEDTPASLEKEEQRIKKEIEELTEDLSLLTRKLKEKEDSFRKIQEKLEAARALVSYREIKLGAPTLTKASSLEEKASFLLDLFHGRRDAFAVRHWNAEKGRASYYPHCLNAWTNKCPRKEQKLKGNANAKIDCSNCSSRLYEPLTSSLIIHRHLLNDDCHGNNAIGIYAMLPGNVCYFVAVDFDEETWQQDALTVADIARKEGFQMAIERSFSGNGAHLWLFFSEAVPAYKARKLAFSFLDKASASSKTIILASYDRVFPTQDRIDEKGLGNLILLPLFCGAAKRTEDKGTLFVDNSFQFYPDQLAFLSSLPRYKEEDVDTYLWKNEGQGADLFQERRETEPDVLWSRKLPKLSQKDALVSPLPSFLSAGISIPKKAMSPKLENALKRMASFSNPEYYKAARRNRGYVAPSVPSFVEGYLESEEVLQLPRGLLSDFLSYMKSSGIECQVEDRRACETKLDASFNGILRREQQEALDALLSKDVGILRAATSFGKTVVAAKLIAVRNERTLILVSKTDLLSQWEGSLERFLTIHSKAEKREGKRLNKVGIGIYSGSKDSACGLVDVATIQSVSSRMPETIKDYGMVIVDECHHIAADSFVKVLQAIRARYVYGLSATVKREDGLESIVYSQCGKVVFEYQAAKLAYERGIQQILVPRFTTSTVSIETSSHFNHVAALKELSTDESRNRLIVEDAVKLFKRGRRVLVLTALLEHIVLLEKLFSSHSVPTVVMTGSLSRKELEETKEAFLSSSLPMVVIATGKFFGEGTDIPALDTLMVATPVAWEGVVSQYAGRIAREYDGKKETLIYDYVDVCIAPFSRMYCKRLTTYQKLGYCVKNHGNEQGENCALKPGLLPSHSFYSQFDILTPFLFAVREAKERIVISSPGLFLSKATQEILEELRKAKERGVAVAILTQPESYAYNQVAQKEALVFLKTEGFSLLQQEECFLHFSVLDQAEVWFGELDILGGTIKRNPDPSDKQKVMMHVFSATAASSLVRLQEDIPGLI